MIIPSMSLLPVASSVSSLSSLAPINRLFVNLHGSSAIDSFLGLGLLVLIHTVILEDLQIRSEKCFSVLLV